MLLGKSGCEGIARVVFEGVFSPPMHLIQTAKDQMEAAEQAEQDIRRATKNQGPKARVRWKAPPAGMIKCNWDAAVDVVGRRMGVGIVIRSHEGEVMATKCSTKGLRKRIP